MTATPGTDPRPSNGENLGPSPVSTFVCTGCGARLSFKPGTRELVCTFCGTRNQIAADDARIEELDFDAYVEELERSHDTYEAASVRCDKCGAEQKLGDNLFAGKCAFCGTGIVSPGYAKRHILPRSIIPFQVDRRKSQDAFRKWVRGLWLAPGELKRYAESDAAMTGMYLPYWTYDCNTASDYSGERGEDYYTNETVTSRNSAGESVSQTQRVKHTNWIPVSGHVERFHDDVLVLASESLPPSLRGGATTFNLKGLVPYKTEFVSGYLAEAYKIGLREGYPIAKETIDAQVYDLVRRDIGGDGQRVTQVHTRYDHIHFKHILLPVWISAYRYRNKTFRFLVNGQTGEVAGESPVSWQKATLLVIAVIIFLIVVAVIGGGSHR